MNQSELLEAAIRIAVENARKSGMLPLYIARVLNEQATEVRGELFALSEEDTPKPAAIPSPKVVSLCSHNGSLYALRDNGEIGLLKDASDE